VNKADILGIIRYFFNVYPRRSILVIIVFFVASVFEGLGIVTLLPLLGVIISGQTSTSNEGSSEFVNYVIEIMRVIGVPFEIGALLMLIVLCLILKELLTMYALILGGYSTAKIALDLREKLTSSMLSAKWAYFTSLPTGKVSNAISTEATRASSIYMIGIKFFMNSFQIVIYTTLALLISWQIALASLVTGIVSYLLLNRLVRMSHESGILQTNVYQSLIIRITDSLSAIKALKAMGYEKKLNTSLSEEVGLLNVAARKLSLSQAIMIAAQQIIPLILIGIVAYIGLVALKVPLTGFIVSVVLFKGLLDRMNTVQKLAHNAANKESAFWAIKHMIDESIQNKEKYTGSFVPTLNNKIVFDKVELSYGNECVLKDVSVSIKAKSLSVFVGMSGAGKTTLVDSIIGFNKPSGGQLYIDETDLNDIDMHKWRTRVGYVSQDVVLFNDSIFSNISLGDENLSAKDIEEALEMSGAYEFVMNTPDKLYSSVGERGAKLSGGQRQRIAVARALVRKPEILILDEATANLDIETEIALSELIKKLSKKVTVIAISHRPKLIELADKVYTVENGTVLDN